VCNHKKKKKKKKKSVVIKPYFFLLYQKIKINFLFFKKKNFFSVISSQYIK